MKQTKLLGGDVKSTHLVKGLDFALLQRVRAGEDVMEEAAEKEEAPPPPEEELEEKLEMALEKEVVAVERKKEKKHGELAVAVPRTRGEILAELKRSREAAKEAAKPKLSDKFKKIGEQKVTTERTENGVKVKHVVGPDGKVKRKVKRSEKEQKANANASPPPETRVMGMMPPPPPSGMKSQPQEEEDEDDDIFAGAGDYDPLADLGDDDESDTEPTKRQKQDGEVAEPAAEPEAKLMAEPTSQPKPPSAAMPPPPRPVNYFNESPTEAESDTYKPPTSAAGLLASDPGLAAALEKLSKIAPTLTKEEEEREKRRKALVEAHERDSYDIDMGFGGSTDYGDDDDETVDTKGAGKKRKRGGGPKKKGDKNSADVVGKIVEAKYGKGDK